MTRDDLAILIGILVGVVWAFVAIASVVTEDFTALSVTTPVMLIIVGFLFGRSKNGKNGGKS